MTTGRSHENQLNRSTNISRRANRIGGTRFGSVRSTSSIMTTTRSPGLASPGNARCEPDQPPEPTERGSCGATQRSARQWIVGLEGLGNDGREFLSNPQALLEQVRVLELEASEVIARLLPSCRPLAELEVQVGGLRNPPRTESDDGVIAVQ